MATVCTTLLHSFDIATATLLRSHDAIALLGEYMQRHSRMPRILIPGSENKPPDKHSATISSLTPSVTSRLGVFVSAALLMRFSSLKQLHFTPTQGPR